MPNLTDVTVIILLGFLVPLLYVAECALLIQYFFIYVTLFVWRILAVEELLSKLVGVPDLMNFEREFGRLYFHPGWRKAAKDVNRDPKSKHRSFFKRIECALRPQMMVHYLIAFVAALPALGSLRFIFLTKFERYPLHVIAALAVFILGLLVDLGLILKKKGIDEEAEKIYQRMMEEYKSWGQTPA